MPDSIYTDGTSPVNYAYDVVQIGCRDSVSNGVSTTAFTAYYPECLVKTSQQTPDGQPPFPALQYTYNLARALTTEKYPSGRTVTTGYDIAGRPTSVTASFSSGPFAGTPTAYASNITYWPHGAVNSLPLLNGITETSAYNNRLQMSSVTAAKGGTRVLSLAFTYDTNGHNNGNLQSQTISYDSYGPETALSLTQNYVPPNFAYDAVNRITGFSEGCINQNYSYDQFGNRWVPGATGSCYTLSGLTPAAQSVYNASNNRINGVGYDNRGNQTFVSPFTLAYDQEDRQTSATSSMNGSASYAYDGDGHRVQKITCSGTAPCASGEPGVATTSYVYDAFGQLVAEYGPLTTSNGTEYLTADHLGSTRLVTDSSANVLHRYDYLPFGEELFAGVNGRSNKYPAQTADGDTIKFTGKERDAESGLDFFGARYFSGGQGRFTSADPLLNSAHPWNPQTWNRYAYGLNNPLKFTDPTGLYNVIDHCGDDKKCEKKFQKSATELSKAVDKLQKAVDKMKDGAEKARLQASLKALGTSGDENNVYVSFTALSGKTAGTTESTQNHQSNDTGMQNFNVTLDPSENSDTSTMAINAAHEGTHVSDFETEQNPLFMGTVLMPFQLEYRGYQTSSYAAEALGEPSWATDNGRNVIWNSSWAAADRATQRDTGITNHVVDKDHPEVQPHNPWPN